MICKKYLKKNFFPFIAHCGSCHQFICSGVRSSIHLFQRHLINSCAFYYCKLIYSQNFRNCKKHYNTDSSDLKDNLLSSDSQSDYVVLNLEIIMNDCMDTLANPIEGASHFGWNRHNRRSSISSNNNYFLVRQSLLLLPIFNGKKIFWLYNS